MDISTGARPKPEALALLSSERPRNVGWLQAAGLLFGDWGTSRLYVLGLAFFFAGSVSFYLICAMSLLILAVGWAYTQICRIYPDGGGVYTAARQRSRQLAVIGALLLFADYVVTASLSALDAFHYFNLPAIQTVFALRSPGLWAIIAIAVIGLFNLMGPKHTGGFAIAAALGMVGITLLIALGAVPQVQWEKFPQQITLQHQPPRQLWTNFVSIVLALSGVEAIANLTGVMKKPVARTARRAIWVVAAEVAAFNVILAACMVAILPHNAPGQSQHRDDMLAFLSGAYLGHWAELCVRAVGGVLLLSATNTAITDMISVQYLMARDGELPIFLQKLNRFGVPWMPAVIAAAVPGFVLLLIHDVERLAHLYAIGVVGAVAINVTLCAFHPRLRRLRRKGPMILLGLLLLAIWLTLAYQKREALLFVIIVMIVGLSARKLNKLLATRKGPRPSLIRQAIMEQLTPEALARPRTLIGTYGSIELAETAAGECAQEGHTLVVCFIRQVSLSYKYEGEPQLTIETDQAALKTFSRFLEVGHTMGVAVLPVYDTGPDAAVLLAENAAIHGCQRVLIGSSRQGALFHLIKGHFQRRLEAILPPDIPVEVVGGDEAVADKAQEPIVSPSHRA
jgi:amino acid transporter